MSVILDMHQDPNYEPSHSEIVEYGKWLGMSIPGDENLLWIAREGLKAPLPEHWKACKSEKGELYYFNFKTGQSIWDHPLDDHYKQLFRKEKENPSAKSRPASVSPQQTEEVVVLDPAANRKKSKQQLQQQPAAVQPAATTQQQQQRSTSADSRAAAASSGKLPPSGKSTPTASSIAATPSILVPAKVLPSLAAVALPGTAQQRTSPTTAAPPVAGGSANSGSDDDRGSQDGRGSRGKLKELKTLKTRKELPSELRLDTLSLAEVSSGGSVVPAVSATSSTVSTPTLGEANRVPLPNPVSILVSVPQSKPPVTSFATANSNSSQHSSGSTSPIAAMATPQPSASQHAAATLADAMEDSPITQDMARQSKHQAAAAAAAAERKRSVSFTNEELALANEGRRQQIEAELVAELEKFREEEAQRTQRLKDEYAAHLDLNLRKSKEALKVRHEQMLVTYEEELRQELREKKNHLVASLQEELKSFRVQEEEQQKRRMHGVQEDIRLSMLASTADAANTLKDGVAGIIASLEQTHRVECARFTAALEAAAAAEQALLQAARNEQSAALKSQLVTEQNLISARIRELQTECNAKLSVLKLDHEAALQLLEQQHDEDKNAAMRKHHESMAALQKQNQLQLAQLELQLTESMTNARERLQKQSHAEHDSDLSCPPPLRSLTASRSRSPPHATPVVAAENNAQHNSSTSTNTSSDGSMLADLAHSLHQATQTMSPQQSAAAAIKQKAPAPLSEEKLGLANSVTLSSSGQSPDDLRTLLVDVLRDVFKGSPFIIASSPPSHNPSAQVSPTTFGREIERNTASNPLPAHSQAQPLQSMHTSAGVVAAPQKQSPPQQQAQQHQQPCDISFTPGSFEEQRSLLADERRRLLEATAFVQNQRAGLEERRAQLKAARRHWKADVMQAKAQGVSADSNKGRLLQKVQRVLEKQSLGLQHDDNLLKDSEHWLKTKESRLLRLEAQMDEHERSRHGASAVAASGSSPNDVSMLSVDTTALVTGFFKPSPMAEDRDRLPHRSSSAKAPTKDTDRVQNGTSARSMSPVLSKALERIEKRLDKVASLVAVQQQQQHTAATSASHKHHAKSTKPASRSSSRNRGAPDRHVDFITADVAAAWSDAGAASRGTENIF